MAEGAHPWFDATSIQQGAAVRVDAAGPVSLAGLSSQQKREVASLTAAGIASAVFFVVPLLNGTGAEQRLPASAIIVQMATAPAPPVPTRLFPAVVRARVLPPRLPRRELRPLALAGPARVVIWAAPPREAETFKKTPGPVMRALVGDGRYRVQPFPMLNDRN